MPDGKQLLASGIEAGHGVRDYLIDLSNGNAKPITPEGTAGVRLSPDGRSIAVIGPDGKWGIWPLDGSGLRPVPGLDSKYYVSDWSPDGTSLYVLSSQTSRRGCQGLSSECRDRQNGVSGKPLVRTSRLGSRA